jgi:hypothetical protein
MEVIMTDNVTMLKKINPQCLKAFEEFSLKALELKYQLLYIMVLYPNKFKITDEECSRIILWHVSELLKNRETFTRFLTDRKKGLKP